DRRYLLFYFHRCADRSVLDQPTQRQPSPRSCPAKRTARQGGIAPFGRISEKDPSGPGFQPAPRSNQPTRLTWPISLVHKPRPSTSRGDGSYLPGIVGGFHPVDRVHLIHLTGNGG